MWKAFFVDSLRAYQTTFSTKKKIIFIETFIWPYLWSICIKTVLNPQSEPKGKKNVNLQHFQYYKYLEENTLTFNGDDC